MSLLKLAVVKHIAEKRQEKLLMQCAAVVQVVHRVVTARDLPLEWL